MVLQKNHSFVRTKKGQVTLFVIVAVLLVGATVSFFLLRNTPVLQAPPDQNPRAFISSCVTDIVRDASKKILESGGTLQPSKTVNYSFNSQIGQEPYTYLCHTADSFQTCYTLHPLLISSAQEELTEETEESVKTCFTRLSKEFENQGFSVSNDFVDYNITILPGQVKASIFSKLTLSKDASSQTFDSFTSIISSPLYDLLDLAEKISAAESTYCTFDYNAYMTLFPDFNIRRIDFQTNKIYRITHRPSDLALKFAIRSCAFPV